MNTLTLIGTTLLTYGDGHAREIYAVWADAIGQFAVIHDEHGCPLVIPSGVAVRPLTADELTIALTPPRHPAYDLAEKGTAVRPEWANRYAKAARLVESGAVRLTGDETALVVGDGGEHRVDGRACDCQWQTHHPGDPCSHYMAVRMARALGQAVQPLTELEDRRAMEAQREQRRAETAARADQANYEERRRQAQARRDGLGAERWIKMAAANGQTAIPENIYRRAHGDPAVLAAAKAEALADIRKMFGGD